MIGLICAILVMALMAAPAGAASKKKSKAAKAAARAAEREEEPLQNVNLKVWAPVNVPSGFGIYFSPSIGYERSVGADNSWVADLSYSSPATDYSIIGLSGGYRWWLGERIGRLQGWYAGPKGYVNMFSYPVYTYTPASTFPGATTVKKDSKSVTSFGIGGEGGYQWVFNEKFVVGAGGELLMPLGSIDGYNMGLTIMAKGSIGLMF